MADIDYRSDPLWHEPGDPTTVYRFFDDHGLLLYVGIARSPFGRLSQHKHDKPWWHDIAKVTMKHYPNRLQALHAEREGIRLEEPLYNVVHNQQRKQSVPPSHPVRRAAELDPRIMTLFKVLQAVRYDLASFVDAGDWAIGAPNDDPGFCAHTLWYGGTVPLRSLVSALAGWGATSAPDPWLRTPEAYDAVYQAAYDTLPDCAHVGGCGYWSDNGVVHDTLRNVEGGELLLPLVPPTVTMADPIEEDEIEDHPMYRDGGFYDIPQEP